MFGYRDRRSFTPSASRLQQASEVLTADTHPSHKHPAQASGDVQNDEEQEGSGEVMEGPDDAAGSPHVFDAVMDGKSPFFLPPFFSYTTLLDI